VQAKPTSGSGVHENISGKVSRVGIDNEHSVLIARYMITSYSLRLTESYE